MKKLKPGEHEVHKWFHGMRVRCGQCGFMGELQDGDYVNTCLDKPLPNWQVYCDNCMNTIVFLKPERSHYDLWRD